MEVLLGVTGCFLLTANQTQIPFGVLLGILCMLLCVLGTLSLLGLVTQVVEDQ